MRRYATDAEKTLWGILRNRKVAHLKFRRQHFLKGFVLDFYCPEEQLGIEIDGGIHKLPGVLRRDGFKESIIKKEGIDLIRFSSDDVLNYPEDVVDAIIGFIRFKKQF